jgi:hypothetical protein
MNVCMVTDYVDASHSDTQSPYMMRSSAKCSAAGFMHANKKQFRVCMYVCMYVTEVCGVKASDLPYKVCNMAWPVRSAAQVQR